MEPILAHPIETAEQVDVARLAVITANAEMAAAKERIRQAGVELKRIQKEVAKEAREAAAAQRAAEREEREALRLREANERKLQKERQRVEAKESAIAAKRERLRRHEYGEVARQVKDLHEEIGALAEHAKELFCKLLSLTHEALHEGEACDGDGDEDAGPVKIGRFGNLEVVPDEEVEEGAEAFDGAEYARTMASLRRGVLLSAGGGVAGATLTANHFEAPASV